MATDWNKLKVVDLKAELKRLGLPQNGLKADLVARLEAAESERAASQSSDTATEEVLDVNGESQQQQDAIEATEPCPSVESLPVEPLPVRPIIERTECEAASATQAASETTIETQEPPSPPSPRPTSLQPTEEVQDSQKRKRRSLSPPPSVEQTSRKRAKQENHDSQETHAEDSPPDKFDEVERLEERQEDPTQAPVDVEMGDTKEDSPLEPESKHGNNVAQPSPPDSHHRDELSGQSSENSAQATTFEEPQADEPSSREILQPYTEHPTEIERDVEPSIHPATSTLYIKNFMRPLRPQAVKDHLLDLATPVGAPPDDTNIVEFYLDTIRTHAFVVFDSISAASRVRTALHSRIWPDETNRKPLWVDFVPRERFEDWVSMEQASTGARGSSSRYEVVYDSDANGNVAVRLEECDGMPPAQKQVARAPTPQAERKPPIPTGPSRSFLGVEGAPLGPRGFQPGRGSRMDRVDQSALSTNAYPSVTYQPVSDELVRRRLDAIAAAKTMDQDRDFGKEYKRYYFESGDVLVDRGPEIFLGIRPPHRERERERDRRHDQGRDAGRGRRGGRPRRGGGMPLFHGVPRGGDRFRPQDHAPSGPNGRPRYGDDRGGRRDNYSRY
ncbi:hypothetical protein GGS23DRAFT_545408 [Durotheca rogersii]|uniref:uncharacterized protein n=1 Tax=Durotheca rogersii TaxID=419775 RepID=UPI0022209CD6|nr:uncharacterized protein GGS23DRAFT_545408 [Durotheca rogersii]KAI5868427.1 hypothetical protein GGS23DRAFT_545408 [Durotheca rogersii]